MQHHNSMIVAAIVLFNLFMASLQQRCPDSALPTNSGKFTIISSIHGDVKIRRPNSTCPLPLNVMIEINNTVVASATVVVDISYQGRLVQLYGNNTSPDGLFTLTTIQKLSDPMGFNLNLTVNHTGENSFQLEFEVIPNLFGLKSFGPFRIDESSLSTLPSVHFCKTEKAIMTMTTKNFANCTDQVSNFDLPLTLELLNGSQCDLQKRSHMNNDTLVQNNAAMTLIVYVNHTCLDNTTVKTNLILPNLPEMCNMCKAIIRVKLSESTARPDKCTKVIWTDDDKHCQAEDHKFIAAIVVPVVAVLIVIMMAVVAAIVCCACYCKRTAPTAPATELQSYVITATGSHRRV